MSTKLAAARRIANEIRMEARLTVSDGVRLAGAHPGSTLEALIDMQERAHVRLAMSEKIAVRDDTAAAWAMVLLGRDRIAHLEREIASKTERLRREARYLYGGLSAIEAREEAPALDEAPADDEPVEEPVQAPQAAPPEQAGPQVDYSRFDQQALQEIQRYVNRRYNKPMGRGDRSYPAFLLGEGGGDPEGALVGLIQHMFGTAWQKTKQRLVLEPDDLYDPQLFQNKIAPELDKWIGAEGKDLTEKARRRGDQYASGSPSDDGVLNPGQPSDLAAGDLAGGRFPPTDSLTNRREKQEAIDRFLASLDPDVRKAAEIILESNAGDQGGGLSRNEMMYRVQEGTGLSNFAVVRALYDSPGFDQLVRDLDLLNSALAPRGRGKERGKTREKSDAAPPSTPEAQEQVRRNQNREISEL